MKDILTECILWRLVLMEYGLLQLPPMTPYAFGILCPERRFANLMLVILHFPLHLALTEERSLLHPVMVMVILYRYGMSNRVKKFAVLKVSPIICILPYSVLTGN